MSPQDIEQARLVASEVVQRLTKLPIINPEWLTPEQAARFLGTSVGLLEQRRKRGGGPRYSRHGQRIVRYRVSDLHLWMEAGYVSA
jgi:hypothetical protein